jgi:hypothetical protein
VTKSVAGAAAVRALLADPNAHEGVVYSHPSKPEGMRADAPGISPTRWQGARL